VNRRLEIVEELRKTLSEISDSQCEEFLTYFTKSSRYFFAGAGRSGFIMRGFAMRVMHMGYTSYFVGEPTTPSICKDDVLIIASGSGNTESLVSQASKAKALGATILLLTINLESKLANLADFVLRIPGSTPKAKEVTGVTSIQPMGSLLEQTIYLTLDSIVLQLMEGDNINTDEMFKNHANLE
jgi:6-phospho-3-hexuloisomerase